MEEADVERFIRNIENLEEKDEKEFADSVLQVSMKENARAFDIAKEVSDMCEALRELMRPELEEARKEGELIGKVKVLREFNWTVEMIAKQINLSEVEVENIIQRIEKNGK